MTYFIKFIHLLTAVSLVGSLMYCLAAARVSVKIHQGNLALCLVAFITGTLLVMPSHFTFHTPWIKAAYLLLVLITVGIVLLSFFEKRKLVFGKLAYRLFYLFLVCLLMIVVHDAVTKTSLLT